MYHQAIKKHILRSSLIIVFLSLHSVFGNLLLAQNPKIGNWFIYFGNQKINKKINWHNEIQYRNYNFIGDLNQLLVRTGIGINLTENNNNFLVGYGFIQTKNYTSSGNISDKITNNEHRIFQQFITKQSFNNYFIQHRYRIEERFFKNDFTCRFRYFLSVNKPITKKTMEKNAIYISAYNELFLNVENTIFDRNRLYTALGFVLHKDIKLEMGMMAQLLEKNRFTQFQIVVFNNLPF